MRAIYHITPVLSLKTDGVIIGNIAFSIDVGLEDDGSVTFFDSAPVEGSTLDDGSTPQDMTGRAATPRQIGDSATPRGRTQHHHEGARLADHGRKAHEAYKAAVEGSTPGAGGPSAAVTNAERLEGAHEVRDNALIRKYLATGGHGMNPADTAWCAAFVGASLRKAGVRDTGSNMAVSYEHWGKHVDPSEGVQKGDVYVEEHGGGHGHVGLLTGRVKDGKVEVISGNYSDRVKKAWKPIGPHHSQIRRAAPNELGPQSSLAQPQHLAMNEAAYRRSQMLKDDPGARGVQVASMGRNDRLPSGAYAANTRVVPGSNKDIFRKMDQDAALMNGRGVEKHWFGGEPLKSKKHWRWKDEGVPLFGKPGHWWTIEHYIE